MDQSRISGALLGLAVGDAVARRRSSNAGGGEPSAASQADDRGPCEACTGSERTLPLFSPRRTNSIHSFDAT
jgi:hypothetical protein